MRKVIIGDCELYLGDCMDVLPTLPEVDSVVTDPPYGIGAVMQGGTWGGSFDSTYQEWDQKPFIPDSEFLKIAKKMIIWGGNYFDLPPSRCWLVWAKPERGLTMADGELAWCNFDANLRIFDSARNLDGKRQHPTQKPLALMRWCIGFLPDAQTILDPFMGSGTTGVAAVQMGRKFIGIEREPKYFEIACRRIEEAYLQADMFVEPVKVVKPQSMELEL